MIETNSLTAFSMLFSNENLLLLLFIVTVLSLVVTILLQVRFKSFSAQLSQQFNDQKAQSIELIHKLQHSNELSDKYQQHLQQQLNLNHQQITQQQSDLKSIVEQQISNLMCR